MRYFCYRESNYIAICYYIKNFKEIIFVIIFLIKNLL